MREHAFLHGDQEHDRELEPLRVVKRHQMHAFGRLVEIVDVGVQGHFLEILSKRQLRVLFLLEPDVGQKALDVRLAVFRVLLLFRFI
ncbi:MAG: hypothetical protein BWY66_02457 [bacterium ADurb.Bin374]|nr:MAG: hypothetical protein BWY66_02457 [bacterium ADurb.Bin374]